MTDREERQHVIEVLKQMRLDYEDFWEENDTEEIKAFNYAIASIETDLKYDLLYEETSEQKEPSSSEIPTGSIIDWNNCHTSEQLNSIATTKNNLVVDAVSRQAVIDLMMQKWGENFSGDDAMQESIDAIRVMTSVTPQEPKEITLEDVKEYCKPRCLTIISNGLLYELTHPKIKALEQEPVLDKIRAEIAEYGSIMVSYAITKDTKTDKGIEKLVSGVLKQAKEQVLEIIDKYKADKEQT